jgi:hypothetical protein
LAGDEPTAITAPRPTAGAATPSVVREVGAEPTLPTRETEKPNRRVAHTTTEIHVAPPVPERTRPEDPAPERRVETDAREAPPVRDIETLPGLPRVRDEVQSPAKPVAGPVAPATEPKVVAKTESVIERLFQPLEPAQKNLSDAESPTQSVEPPQPPPAASETQLSRRENTEINVTIGTIEVLATPSEQPKKKSPARPVPRMTLEDYRRKRREGR